MQRILVTGAAGHLGTAVIDTLLKQIAPGQISVLTRQTQKQNEFRGAGFEAFLGSYESPGSLTQAMKGVDTVLLISSGDSGDRMQEHRNVVDAAVKMGVEHIAYTSRCLRDPGTLANPLMADHFSTEEYIQVSGLRYTFFRNILYMDAIPQFIGCNRALEKGIFLPAGDGRVSFALRSEMGEAMANVLCREDDSNRIYHYTGSRSWSFSDVAQSLSALSGREVRYTDVDSATFEGLMKQKNLPEPVIQKIAGFITDIRHGQEAGIYGDLAAHLGRAPVGLKDGLKAIFNL